MHGDIHTLPQYIFMAWCLVKHRGNSTVTLSEYNSGALHSIAPPHVTTLGKLMGWPPTNSCSYRVQKSAHSSVYRTFSYTSRGTGGGGGR
jgi:hypothetical protein